MGLSNKIKNKKNAIRPCLVNSVGYYSYYNRKIDSNIVYIVSQSGDNLIGNMLRIAQELSKPAYKNLNIYIQVQKKRLPVIKNIAKRYQIKAKFLVRTSEQVYILEQAKYIFTDVVLPLQFVKRTGQIVVNTWHGTPFKNMGRMVELEKHSIGNIQRNFFMSDYILFPNNYMKEIFIRDYMLENLWKGKSLLAGYPRNAVFFDKKRREEVLKKLNLKGKKVYAYLPTYRGTVFVAKHAQQANTIKNYLDEIDTKLSDDQVLIVKLHLYNKKEIDFSGYKHIIDFPEGYETYDVLNIVDCLITDYSSVLFDFANTKKKIVLFAYDEEEYFSDRGTYFGFDALPFPKVNDVDNLVKEISLPKNYDDKQFLDKYCSFDNINATQLLCKHIIMQKKTLLEEDAPCNGKKNILIYMGNLAKNGITSAAVSLLANLDYSKNNYIAVFSKNITKLPERVHVIPDKTNYYAIDGKSHYRLLEKVAYKKIFQQKENVDTLSKDLEAAFDREWEKYFHGMDIAAVIDFGGYDEEISFIFSRNKTKKIIFVHNDMIKESKTRGFPQLPITHYFYNRCDKVAIVSDNLYGPTFKISENGGNIFTVNNCQNYISIQEKSGQEVTFEKDTECIVNNPKGLLTILNNKEIIKFITIGRFSAVKGHFRLIDAFDMYWRDNHDSFLIIIGGHGDLFDKTIKYVKTKACWGNIFIIKSIMNPMPILKKCNLFVLSSSHEGLPVVLFEADCLHIPILSTDIVGVHELLNAYDGGLLVEESAEGLYKGMKAFDRNEIKLLNIDFEKYNQRCVQEFESLLE